MDRKEEKEEIARVVAELDVHLREPFVAYFESQQRLQRGTIYLTPYLPKKPFD